MMEGTSSGGVRENHKMIIFYIKNKELCIENKELFIKTRDCVLKMMDFAVETDTFQGFVLDYCSIIRQIIARSRMFLTRGE